MPTLTIKASLRPHHHLAADYLAKACNNSLVFILVFVLFVLALVPNFRAEIFRLKL